jgi:hypothetical protein
MPSDMYKDATAEIVTVLGFLMAAFVPAMMLGVTALRAGGFSVKTLRALAAGLDRQVSVFGGLFLYALLACLLAIAGKIADWQFPIVSTGWDAVPKVDLSSVASIILTYLLVLLTLRAVVFIAGVRSVLRLTSRIAESEARDRDRAEHGARADELEAYEMPRDYGSKVNLPH